MSEIDDGGPAFPQQAFRKVGDMEIGESAGGMSLRAWLAGQAIAAGVQLGEKACAIADETIAVLKKPQPTEQDDE